MGAVADNDQPSTSWSTDEPSGEYDIAKFYTRSTERKGESTQVRVTIPNRHFGEIDRLVQQGKFPAYRVREDVLRDALHHRLVYLMEHHVQTPEDRQRLRILTLEMEAANRLADIQQYEQMLKRIGELLAQLQGLGNKAELTELVNKYEVEVDGLPEPWNWRLMDLLRNYQDATDE